MKPLDWCKRVLSDNEVPPNARLVALVLATHAKVRPPSSTMSAAALQRRTGLPRSTLYEAMADLRSSGWVACVPRRRQNGANDASAWLFIDADMPLDEQVGTVDNQGGSVHPPDTPSPGAGHYGGPVTGHLEGRRFTQGDWSGPDLWTMP